MKSYKTNLLRISNFFILIVFIFAISCDKVGRFDSNSNTAELNFEKFSVTINNGILEFQSYDDYEAALDYLSSLSEDELLNWDNQINFKSFEEYSKDSKILDEKLLDAKELTILLNPDYSIVIGDYKFQLDLLGSNVIVSPKDNLKAANEPQTYSMNQNVLDIVLLGVEPETEISEKTVMLKLAGPLKAYTPSGDVTYWIEDTNLGIYFDIVASIKKDFNNNQYLLSVSEDMSYTSWIKTSKKCVTVCCMGDEATNNNKASIKIWWDTRLHRAYEVFAYFYVQDQISDDYYLDFTMWAKKNTSEKCTE